MTDAGYEGETFSKGGKIGSAASRADQGKRIVHTMDADFITGIGRVSAFGAQKYHMRNFLIAPGMSWGRVYDSAIGHLQKFWGGEWLDEESGQPHILMASWNLMVLHQYATHDVYALGDDRPSMVEHKGRKWADWAEDFIAAGGSVPGFESKNFTPTKEVAAEAVESLLKLVDEVNDSNVIHDGVITIGNAKIQDAEIKLEDVKVVVSDGSQAANPSFLKNKDRFYPAEKGDFRSITGPEALEEYSGKVGWVYTDKKYIRDQYELVDGVEPKKDFVTYMVHNGGALIANMRPSEDKFYILGAFDF